MSYCVCFAVAALLSVLKSSVRAEAGGSTRPIPKTASELFEERAVWTIHLKFAPEQWQAMEPKEGSPGGRGGFPGFRPPVVAPSGLLAPAMLHFGGADKQGRLSREAFLALGGKWFEAWDKDGKGVLDSQEVAEGLNVSAPARAMGMNLQGPEGGRNGIASALGIEYSYVRADMEFEGRLFKDVAVRYKGGGAFLESRESLKRPLKIGLNNFNKGQKLAGVTTLNLGNCVTDATYMNEVLAYRLYREAGVPASRTAYARVYVTVTGKYERQYIGLYTLVENIDKDFAEAVFGSRKGAILKPVTPSLFADLGRNWKYYNQTYDPKGNLSDQQVGRVIDLCRLVTYANDAEFSGKLGDFIDIENLSRFMAVMVYLSDVDGILGPGQNLYLHLHPDTNKFTFIPWDQDRSFGNFPMRGSQEQREQLSIHRPWDGQNRFLERVYRAEAFKKAYLANLGEFSKSIFRPERFAQQMDAIAAVIRPGIEAESAENLARFDAAVAGETPPGGGVGGRSGIRQPPGKPVKPFVRIRAQSIVDQLSGKSQGMELGFGRGGGADGGRGPGGFGGGPGGPLAGALVRVMDVDKNGQVSREEFVGGFGRWFEAWNTDKSGLLTEDQLRAGLDKELVTQAGGAGFPGGAPFGR